MEKIALNLLNKALKLLGPVNTHGPLPLQNISAIYMANHQSSLDIYLLRAKLSMPLTLVLQPQQKIKHEKLMQLLGIEIIQMTNVFSARCIKNHIKRMLGHTARNISNNQWPPRAHERFVRADCTTLSTRYYSGLPSRWAIHQIRTT